MTATTLPDGRRLTWTERGPADGRPVVLCPGAAMSGSIGFATDALDDLGVRLISIDRPGLGGSDPDPDRTLLDWPEDVRALGLEDPAVVGYSQGAPFALACAATGVVSRAAVVAGTDELSHPAFAGAHDAHLQAMLDAEPAAIEQSLAGMTAERFVAMVEQMSAPEDLALYEAAGFRRAIEEGFAQGPGGYARDTALAMAPWPFRVEDITVPVDLWYGALDASPVHSPDHGATLERRIPGSRRHLVADAGGAILWTHGREILATLLR